MRSFAAHTASAALFFCKAKRQTKKKQVSSKSLINLLEIQNFVKKLLEICWDLSEYWSYKMSIKN